MDYNDVLYLTDLGDLTLKRSVRTPETSDYNLKTNKTMGDFKQRIENDLNIPESRRDFSFNLVRAWDCVVLIGGWNALEWNPQQVELDIWFLISGTK